MIHRRQLLLAAGAATTALLTAGCLPGRGGRLSDPAFAEVIARLRGHVEAGELPFAALRIARHGEVLVDVKLSGVEAIDADSRYRIYSMTKPVVAAAVVLLVEEGRLRLDDPVADYVPEFAALQVLGGDGLQPARRLCVGHLLSHTAGLANSWGDSAVAAQYREAGLIAGAWMYDPAIGGLAGFARRLAALPLAAQPGDDWIYGYGLDIAGLIVERISGQRLGDFLRQRFFDPLGMRATGFHVPAAAAQHLAGLYHWQDGRPQPLRDGRERAPLLRPQADAGSGGLVSTLEDYGRFADMLAQGGSRNGVRVLAPASVRRLMTPWRDPGADAAAEARIAASLSRFGQYPPGSLAQALGGVVRLDDRAGPGSQGEYAWGGAAGTGFWAAPQLGVSFTFMTQLMPATALPARETLRPMVYRALAASMPSGAP